MGKQIVYCEVCGDRILEADIAAGKAVVVAGRDYCAKCRDKAPKVVSPGAAVPAGAGHRAVDSTRRLAAHVRAAGAASTHHAGPAHAPPPSGMNTTLIVGVVIGGIIVLLVLFAMNSGNAPEPTSTRLSTPTVKPSPVDHSAEEAAAAYKRIKEYVQEHPDDAEGIIARIEADKDKLRKTVHWDSVESYLTQARERKDRRDREKRLDESLAKVTTIENGDPRYEQRPKVQGIFSEAKAAALALGDAAKGRVDDAEKGYERRYHEAGKAASAGLMARAGRLLKENKFDEALAVLDEFPSSFADCAAAQNIAQAREQVEERRKAATTPTPTPNQGGPIPEWITDLQRVFKALQTDSSEPTFKDAVPVLEKALVNIESYELCSRLGPSQRFQIRCTANYFMAIYLCQFKQDYDKAFAHLTEALRFGVGKESVDYIEKQSLLAGLRKEPRYKAFIDKYQKKYTDPSRRWLGLVAAPLYAPEFEGAGLAADEGGFFVAGVLNDMTAAKLGLAIGDVVISFAGEKLPRVGSYSKLDELLEKTKPDTDYPLVVRKGGGERVTLTVRWP